MLNFFCGQLVHISMVFRLLVSCLVATMAESPMKTPWSELPGKMLTFFPQIFACRSFFHDFLKGWTRITAETGFMSTHGHRAGSQWGEPNKECSAVQRKYFGADEIRFFFFFSENEVGPLLKLDLVNRGVSKLPKLLADCFWVILGEFSSLKMIDELSLWPFSSGWCAELLASHLGRGPVLLSSGG